MPAALVLEAAGVGGERIHLGGRSRREVDQRDVAPLVLHHLPDRGDAGARFTAHHGQRDARAGDVDAHLGGLVAQVDHVGGGCHQHVAAEPADHLDLALGGDQGAGREAAGPELLRRLQQPPAAEEEGEREGDVDQVVGADPGAPERHLRKLAGPLPVLLGDAVHRRLAHRA